MLKESRGNKYQEKVENNKENTTDLDSEIFHYEKVKVYFDARPFLQFL